ncbi:putative amino acid permease [Actinoplanes ianthinogenes]|uniref:Amino acid permease n=2 Tax=Actinoplanes ianthinogenes TaxID=122358 RepID=A0ABN6CE14_9ACTN|nr:putative amino acid permease [Actinoplanes ianthinogenes]GGR20215.1 putative amino acid permease [Actinoplanes ianthinogenes]
MPKSLGVIDGVVIAASSTAATTSIAIGTGVLAATVGRQVPILLVLAFLPMIGIAGAYARLNRSEPDCGAGYTWVGRTLGPWLGFLAGWIPVAGTVIFLAYTTAICGSLLIQTAGKVGLHGLDPDSTAQCTLVGLVVLVAVTWTAIRGVAHAVTFQKYLLIFEYAVLIVFCGWGMIVGDQPFSLSWLNTFAFDSLSGLAQGLVLAVFFYWGWDSAFNVTEETRNPEDASRGGFIALFTMLGLFVLGSIAFQRVLPTEELAENGAQGLSYFAAKLVGEPWASVPLLALMFSAIASVQSGVIPTARLTLAMSRDKTLGPFWARLSKRGAPAAGTVVIAVIAGFVALLEFAIPTLNQAILAAVNTIGLLVAVYYGLTAIASAVRFRGLLRTNPTEGLRAVVIPLLSGTALLALGIYLALYYATLSDSFAISVENGWFNLAAPALIVLLGIGAAAMAKWRRRSPYFARVEETV